MSRRHIQPRPVTVSSRCDKLFCFYVVGKKKVAKKLNRARLKLWLHDWVSESFYMSLFTLTSVTVLNLSFSMSQSQLSSLMHYTAYRKNKQQIWVTAAQWRPTAKYTVWNWLSLDCRLKVHKTDFIKYCWFAFACDCTVVTNIPRQRLTTSLDASAGHLHTIM